jgi:hypothetical protein
VQPFECPVDLAPQGRLKLGLAQHAHEQPFQAIDTIRTSPHHPVQVLEIGPLPPTMATLPLRIAHAHAHAVTLRRGSRLSKLPTALMALVPLRTRLALEHRYLRCHVRFEHEFQGDADSP